MTLLDSLEGPEPRHVTRTFGQDPASRSPGQPAGRRLSSSSSKSELLGKQVSPSERRPFPRRGISPTVTEASEGDPDDDSGYISDRNPTTRKRQQVAPLSKTSAISLGKGVTAPIDPVDDFDESWPPTPDSPDRLPSPTLADRVQPFTPPASETQAPVFVPIPRGTFARTSSYRGFQREPPPLIESDRDIRIVPLAELHRTPTPSPTSSSYPVNPLASPTQPPPPPPSVVLAHPISYPFSLASIYPPHYPHFNLYPSLTPLAAIPMPTAEYTDTTEQHIDDFLSPQPYKTAGYPYSLAELYKCYPPVPFPALVPSVRRPVDYTSASYLHPWLDSSACVHLFCTSSRSGIPLTHNLRRVTYPHALARIFPAVYPAIELYPTLKPKVPRLDIVSSSHVVHISLFLTTLCPQDRLARRLASTLMALPFHPVILWGLSQSNDLPDRQPRARNRYASQ
jgi:hypothetical protein